MDKTSLLAILCILMVLTQPLIAQQKGEGGKSRPCGHDVAKFCPDAGGRRETMQCIRTHKRELSEGCKRHLKKAHTRRRRIRSVCRDDIEKFCGDKKGKLRRCIKTHLDSISDACRALFAKQEIPQHAAEPQPEK